MKKVSKTKILATLIVSFVVFFSTLFALAENKNNNSLFLDSDQDGLTDQEERALGTNPNVADTDGDGYSDGKEVESGYNPLKPAPGDKIVFGSELDSQNKEEKTDLENQNLAQTLLSGTGSDISGLGIEDLTDETFSDLTSDPQNPNLTNEMLGQLMQLSKEKASGSEEFLSNPTFSSEDYAQIAQQSLESTAAEKELPEIKDSEIKILPPVDDKNLEPEKVKEKQKEEIEKYLASIAYVAALNSPFAITDTNQFQGAVSAEGTNLLSALTKGDQAKIDAYAEKAEKSVDQIKQIEVPYILKDFHKAALSLAIYTADMKDNVVISPSDPMKGLVALGSLQKIMEAATKLQDEFKSVLDQYGIEAIEFQ
ncbi:MAG: hypothetical protein A3J76_02530 [Candidatus Moranbacteria bacterium RBG_13_45_13]|nr:MAG: hypothetical protein A3J76_02530 [Candidatus Moranbacteria bacterium RBG_13_45_13]